MLVYRATTIERNALAWFCWRTDIDATVMMHLLSLIRERGYKDLYTKRFVPKQGGGFRVHFVPIGDLKEVQRAILKKLLGVYPRHEASHGFRGRGRVELAQKHALEHSGLITLDVKDAFWQVGPGRVSRLLDPEHHRWCKCFYCQFFRKRRKKPYSWHIRNFITKLCTCKTLDPRLLHRYGQSARYGFLPQGAPTSPSLFDMALWDIDEKLSRKAENLGGAYSRYADNIYFSVEDPSDKLLGAIACSILRYGFPVHKIKIRKQGGVKCFLGLSVEGWRVFSSKAYRGRIRKAAHHLSWCLDNGHPWKSAWQKYQGFVAASVFDELPRSMQLEYDKLHQRIEEAL